MNKAKQFVIGLLCGMTPGHAMLKDIALDSDLAQAMTKVGPITKADIMSPGLNGRSFFEFAETWNNLPALQKVLEDNGERMDSKDFLRGVANGKSLLKMAEDLGVLNLAFSPEIWAGHSREMEHVWYATDKNKRDKFDYLGIRRAVAAAEGREIREDVLARAGITRDNMRDAIRDGQVAERLKGKLAAIGEHFRPEDLLLADSDGDHTMYLVTAWNNAGPTFDELHAQGVQFEPDHFTFAYGNRKSLLDAAIEHKGLKHLFNARMWAGRPEALMELHGHVPADKRGDIDLTKILDQIYDDMYGKIVDVKNSSLQDLVTPLNGKEAGAVLPLGVKAVWDAMPDIRARLAKAGETITIDHLRKPSGVLNESCLTQAVRFGKLDEVMSILADSHAKLSYSDLTAKVGNQADTLLQMICKANQQEALLQPSHWVGRGQELLQVWEAMASDDRKGIDFKHIHSEMNRMTLRQRFGGGQALAL
jgi:hypothetical protein